MTTESQINLGDCWLPYRQLNILIKNAIRDGSVQACAQLEIELNRHKTNFISLLKNPAKNNLHRETVKNASKEGITIIEGQNKFKKVFSQEMVKEALLLSDLFDLNELNALELLITGENQLSRYPDMSRGTVAVLYYYDSKKSLLSALQALVQVSNGRSWSSKLPPEMARCVNKLVNELKEENVVLRCCEILEEFDIKREYDLLETNRGLGPHRYRKQVFDIMKDIRKITANIIFNYSAQSFLSRREIFKIFDILSTKCALMDGCLDVVSTELLIAFLYAFDISFIQELDEDDRQMVKHSWIKNPDILSDLIEKLQSTNFNNVKGIGGIIQFALAISLKTISLYPIFKFETDIDEEKLIDVAIENSVFENLDQLLASNDHLFTEEFFVRRIHSLNCDFIINMSHKIKELRDKIDEGGRLLNAFSAQAIKPFSNLSLQFEKFLRFLSNFYLKDIYKLSVDFWVNLEPEKSTFSKQQILHKFVRSLHESFFPQILHASVINFFRALARTSPFNVFNLIKNTSFHSSIQFSIDSLCETLNNYLTMVRSSDNTERISASSFAGFNNVQPQTKKMVNAESVCAIIDLIQEIVKNDRTCCVAIAETQQYMFIPTMVSILRCAVPREVKAQILKCFGAFATVTPVSTLIWKEIESILPRYNLKTMSHPKLGQNGIAIEIEEIEVKNEEYPITIGFLELMNSLFSHYDSGLNLYQRSASENCFNFVLDSILLKTTFRVFKNEDEKWKIIFLGYKLLLNIVLKNDIMDEGNTRAFNVFSQILQENLLFRHIISSLEESVSFLESHFNQPTLRDYDKLFHEVEGCCINILSLLKNICEKQDIFFELIRGVPGISISTFVKFNYLFNNINPKTNRQDRLVTIFRLISFSTPISINTMKLLNALCQATFEMTYLCLMQVCNLQNPGIKPETLIHTFVECLENESKELRTETLKFIDIYLGNPSTNPRFTFAHKLVGIESKLFSLKSVSLFGQNYTCLHSILSLFDSSIDLRDFIEERKLGMRILYKLCSSIHTSDIVLRVLRSSYEFNTQYLKFWDKLMMESDFPLLELLFEMTYFMKILAIDIRITSDQKLKSYYSSYINFLFKETKQPRLLKFLFQFVFVHEHPSMPEFNYFDTKELMKTISDCMNPDNTIDLPLLHQKLYSEIRALGTQIGFSSSSLLRDEINKIILYCSDVNRSVEEMKQKNDFIEAWCELVQIIILCKCLRNMEEEIPSRYLTEINLELINRIIDPETNELFYKSISSTILITSCELNEIQSKSLTNITSCIRSIFQVLENSSSIWSRQKKARINFYASLLYLFRLLPNPLFKEFKFSTNLLDKLTSDILFGHEVAKMLALSILNRTDPVNWLEELISNGTLNRLLLSLQSDDREIRANKYEFIKTFYVFESKMMLLLRIFSSTNVNFLLNGLLNSVDVVNTLESLQSFDIYPYLICENPVCFKMFTYILRLMITITTTKNRQIITELGSLISSHSILYDLIRMAPTTRETENGRELLLLVSRLIGPLITKVNQNLQNIFIGLLPLFCNDSSFKSVNEIVFIILNACVNLISSNPSNPIFEPSLTNSDSPFYSKQTLGLLVSIISRSTVRSNEMQNTISIIESSLYLLWAHFNIYFSMVELSPELLDDVERLKSQAENTFNDVFFAKIQTVSQKNMFIESLSRKIKKLINLKKNSLLKM